MMTTAPQTHVIVQYLYPDINEQSMSHDVNATKIKILVQLDRNGGRLCH